MAAQVPIIHQTADVSPRARIGMATRIWHFAQIREGAVIGNNCIVGKDAYIDHDVHVGDNVKIQNAALVYHGATLEDGVFIGPRACLTNDRFPRAINHEGDLKSGDEWEVGPILVRYGASVGAGAIILPNVTIGRFAMIAAGAVVTRDVCDHGLVVGVPAKWVGYVCRCGQTLEQTGTVWRCPECDWTLEPDGEGGA